jgi:hypothetical protein
MAIKKIGFGSPKQNDAGIIEMNNFKPGDTIKFGLGITTDKFTDNSSTVVAKLYTNINNNLTPRSFYSIPMNKIKPSDEHELAFETEITVSKLGNYKVTAMISDDGGKNFQFINDYGLADLTLRPKASGYSSLNIRQINIGKANVPNNSQEY